MAAVNALKKIVEAADAPTPLAGPEQSLLEIFCVDTSISMARSQSFPYIFGESKLSLCKRIIAQGFALPDQCALYTALVKFNASPSLAIPFALHTHEQNEAIKTSLSHTEHQKGSTIYTSYAFCEKTISEFQHEHGLQGCKVLIHLFTDGIDNGSAEEDVAKYHGAIEPNSVVGLRQSFLYSFDTAFEQSSALAKSLQAHLVTIHESELNTALEERDRWVLKFLAAKPKVAKVHKGFNLAKGYTPDLASVYGVLMKTYRFFSSGKSATSKEGLFRVNANVNESKRLASQLLSNTEHLNDFEDAILVAHALKTALANGPPILPTAMQQVVIDVSHQPKAIQFTLLRPKIMELPQLNKECLHILLFLLNIVAKESAVNKMTSTNLAVIFTYLLFPELLVPNPGLQELVVALIDQCDSIFPQPPLLKPSAQTSNFDSNTNDSIASSSNTNPGDPKIANHSDGPFDPTTGLAHTSKTTEHILSHAQDQPSSEEAPPRVKRAHTTSLHPSPHDALRLPTDPPHVRSGSHGDGNHERMASTDAGKMKRAESATSALHRPLPPHLRTSFSFTHQGSSLDEPIDPQSMELDSNSENTKISQNVHPSRPTPPEPHPPVHNEIVISPREHENKLARPVPPTPVPIEEVHSTLSDGLDSMTLDSTTSPRSVTAYPTLASRVSAPPTLVEQNTSTAPTLPLPCLPTPANRSTIGPISSAPPHNPPPGLPSSSVN